MAACSGDDIGTPSRVGASASAAHRPAVTGVRLRVSPGIDPELVDGCGGVTHGPS
jgi:hypothetical protein